MHTLKVERNGGQKRELYAAIINTNVNFNNEGADVEFTQVIEGDEIGMSITLRNDDRAYVLNDNGDTVDIIYSTQSRKRNDASIG
jgi:hypothetical protein